MGLIQKAHARATEDRDAGYTTMELLVVMLISTVLISAVVGALHVASAMSRNSPAQNELWSQTADVQGQLVRDVTDAFTLTVASDQKLTLKVTRDKKCNVRSYDLSGTKWTVTTDYYADAKCSGAKETKIQTLANPNGEGALVPAKTKFRYYNANGAPMEYGFDQLVAHAARTRALVAGTVIGSGTVSNENCREIGSSCIAERRGIEILDHGEATTGFMRYGDTVRMEAHLPDGRAPFGALLQKVVRP